MDDLKSCSFLLNRDNRDLIASLSASGKQIDGLNRALEYAARVVKDRRVRIARIRDEMKEFNISLGDLGDVGAVRKDEARAVLVRLRQGLKRQGKKAVIELIDKECRTYGVDLRGGFQGDIIDVQNSPVIGLDGNKDTGNADENLDSVL